MQIVVLKPYVSNSDENIHEMAITVRCILAKKCYAFTIYLEI